MFALLFHSDLNYVGVFVFSLLGAVAALTITYSARQMLGLPQPEPLTLGVIRAGDIRSVDQIAAPAVPEFTPLADAMREVHEAMLGTKVAVFARTGTKTPDDVLTWYAHAVQSKGISIYGQQPPSQVPEVIPSVEFPGLEFKKHLSQVWQRFGNEPRYIECAIKPEDVKRCIEIVGTDLIRTPKK